MKSIPTYAAAGAMLALFAGFALPSAQSAVLYTWEEPFSAAAPGSNLPADWVGAISGTDPNAGTIAISEVSSGKWRLMLRRDTGGNLTAFYTGSQGPIENGVIENFHASVILNASGGTAANFPRGIVARAQSTSSTISGYYAYVRADTIFISLNGNIAANSSLVEAPLIETLAKDTDYEFHFTAVDFTLTASVYKADAFGDFTILLGSVSTEHNLYTSGLLGLRTAPDGNNRFTTFSNLKVEVIPEPSLAWGALAVLGWFGWRQRQKRGVA